ncbi:MAG TPA: hypothetical protein VNO32_54425 [Candidatus Acidoferrum sp.]|nr:hypothetical protein [Candidatus Acidoferrum sp.]
METKLLSSLGEIAGVGGIALGVFFLLNSGVLQQKFAVIGAAQAYALMQSLMTFTFGISGIGIISWIISLSARPRQPMPMPPLAILASLFIVVILASVYIGTRPVPQSELPPQPAQVHPIDVCMGNGGGQSCLGPGVVAYTCDEYNAIGGGAQTTYIALNKRFCQSGPEKAKDNVRHNYSRDGGQCGWTSFTVTCAQ